MPADGCGAQGTRSMRADGAARRCVHAPVEPGSHACCASPTPLPRCRCRLRRWRRLGVWRRAHRFWRHGGRCVRPPRVSSRPGCSARVCSCPAGVGLGCACPLHAGTPSRALTAPAAHPGHTRPAGGGCGVGVGLGWGFGAAWGSKYIIVDPEFNSAGAQPAKPRWFSQLQQQLRIAKFEASHKENR